MQQAVSATSDISVQCRISQSAARQAQQPAYG